MATTLLPAIVPLHATDPRAVDQLLDTAFGRDRHGRTAYRLREGMTAVPDLSFAALDGDDVLVGSLQSWPIALHADAGLVTPLILVGPVAVAPDHRGQGIGQRLMTEMTRAADRTGAAPQVLIGDPEYYGRFFGFTADATAGWTVPGPVERRRLLARTGGRSLPGTGLLGPRPRPAAGGGGA